VNKARSRQWPRFLPVVAMCPSTSKIALTQRALTWAEMFDGTGGPSSQSILAAIDANLRQ